MRNAARFPEKTSLLFEDQTLTFSQCVEQVRQVSGALSAVGIGHGSHVGLLLNNSIEFVTILLGIADLNATAVPLDPSISDDDLLTAIDSSDIKYLIGKSSVLANTLQPSITVDKKFSVGPKNCITVGGDISHCHNLTTLMAGVSQNYRLGQSAINDKVDFILAMTSGSTSAPKPVVFTQETKLRRCFSAQQSYGLNEDDIILFATPLHHSSSQ